MRLQSIANFRSVLIYSAAGCLLAASAFGADAGAGKAVFAQRCSVCHTAESADNGGAQGPSLIGLMGRAAASAPQFSYTAALRNSKLTWDAPTLERFLAAPSTLVPGTSMLVAVPDQADRGNLIAYFQSVAGKAAPAEQAAAIPASTVESANWRLDAPGRLHHISAAVLPAAFATASSRNSSSVVPRPANAELALPPGFHVDVFATSLTGPRKMLVAQNGDIFVTELRAGRVTILHPSSDGRRAAGKDVYLEGLKLPFGLAFYPNAQHPEWLYVSETNRVTRYAFQTGDLKPRGAAQIVVAELPSGFGHSTRDIAFSPDGRHLFVSVGSGSNVAESMSKRTPAEIKSWEAQHGLGAAWGEETDRAAVLEFDAHSPGTARNYANGIRNCVSLTVQPVNGALWCTTNERDALGDDLVPDYSTRVTRGQFYGWPWYYLGSNQDPRHKDERPDLRGRVSVPDVLYQSHSAALSMTFYAASSGKAAFPAAYAGDAIVGFHGSWNRSLRTGYKLVRVHMKNGEPTGDYEDFLTGFVVDDAHVWGRPVATAELADGSLLMSEDGNNVIFRISHGH
ncbi:MAG TPA: PQQ-dependent sugar dehydrogenase [Steroidobacteraceae bacterium]|nr:PQQ-dependent sugar dehydrogenase [Steroidobacteraceae bacterium]